MARFQKRGNILRGVGTNPDRDDRKGDAVSSFGNMPEVGGDYPGQAKTGYGGPMSKFGRNSGPNNPGDSYKRAANNKMDGAPDQIGGLAGRGNASGRGWPKGLRFDNASGGTDWPSGAAPKGPAPDKLGTPGTPKRGNPQALVKQGIAGHSPTPGVAKRSNAGDMNASLPGKGWPKSLRKDLAGHVAL